MQLLAPGTIAITFLFVDLAAPLAVGLGALYVLVVLATLPLSGGLRLLPWAGGIATACVVVGWLASPSDALAAWNRGLALLAVWVAVVVLRRERQRSDHAEIARHGSEARARLGSDSRDIIAFSWDIAADRLRRHSVRAAPLFGNGAQEGSLAAMRDLVHPDDRSSFQRRIDEALQSESGRYENEFRIVARDGAVRWLSERGRVSFDAAGRPLRLDGLARDVTARKQAQHDLERSETELAVILQTMPAYIYVLDAADHYLHVNSRYEQLVGRDLDHLRRHTPADLFGAEAAAEFLRHNHQVMAENRTFEFEERGDFGGEVRVFHSIKAPLPGSDGRPIGVVGISTDITDRKSMEAALQRSERQFRTLAENAPDTVVRFDRRGRHVYFNPAAETAYSVPRDDALGRTDREIGLPEPLLGEQEATVREVFETGCPATREVTIGHDGHPRVLEIRYVPEPAADGAVETVLAIGRDVTERNAAAQILRESEERFRQLADSMPQLVWAADANGEIEYYNRRVAEYSGVRADREGRWVGLPTVHEDDVGDSLAAWQAALATGGVYECEHRIRAADGSYRWHLSRACPMCDADGAIVKWFGTATDIHERKCAEAKLAEADSMKDQFVATLAHELRNPLAPIRNAVQILRLPGTTPSDVKLARDMIDRQVDHLVRLVDDLLDVSRITLGKIHLRRKRLDLREVVEDALATSRPLLDRSHHRVTLDLPDHAVPVDGDEVRLAQVISNLLNNAARFTPERGDVHLALVAQRGEAIVSVLDTGIGIPHDMLPRIFEPFVQVEPGRGRTYGGLGIGLSLVDRLVTLHGGSVTAESEGLGHGSRFTVRLPLAVPVEPRTEPPVEDDGAEHDRRRVLVVDDNADVARSQAALLRLLGHEVVCAFDGPTALLAAAEFRPDVALLDIGMPEMNGYELARRLRELPELEATRLIAQTGWGRTEDRERSAAAGFEDHLTKPASLDCLRRILDRQPAR